jgi:hypothetical protein
MQPKNPKNKKAAGKAAANPPASKMNLNGCTQEEWEADCVCPTFAIAEWQDWRLAAAAKKVKATNVKHVVALTATMTASPWRGSQSGPTYIPGMASSSTP